MNNKLLILILVTGLLISNNIQAQERLVSAGQNPFYPDQKPQFKSGLILNLPFLEDFSGKGIYPDPEKWTDNNVYLNNSYPIDQPGYGVATLDGIDSIGNVYAHASISSYRADFLTSQAINLNIGDDTTVYLSFYYQAQGLGDSPEPGDSLVLEFYSPSSNSWHWAWSTPGHEVKEFSQVLINVKGAAFLQEGFRFRFVNYASLANAYEPTLKVNADHWHLDYIYLNNGRNYQDTTIMDLSLLDPPGSLLLKYTSMPWGHFKTVGISAVKSLFPIHLQNLSGERRFYSPVFKITDIYGTGQGYEINLQAEEIRSFERLIYEAPFNYSFTSDSQDTASFLISFDLKPTEPDLIPENTRLETIQKFGDYYSYDDGMAESGYGLVGEGASNGRVACRFENLVPTDSLVGLEIFFNKSYKDANQKYFNFAVWNEINGKPGDLLYKMNGLRSDFNQGLTEFNRFLLDSAQIVPSAFYIGWIQVTNDFLNVGFDRNNNNQNNIFYTMDGTWRNTSFEGSLMIRPVFANKSKKIGSENKIDPVSPEELKVYPNPASSYINIDFPSSWSKARLILLDIQGRTVLTENRISEQLLLPSLNTGTYFLIIQNSNGESIHKKLLITNE